LLKHVLRFWSTCSSEKQHVNAFLEGSGLGALKWTYQVKTSTRITCKQQTPVDDHDAACKPTLRTCSLDALGCQQNGSVTLQIPEEKSKDGSWVQKGSKPVLALSHQQVRQAQQHSRTVEDAAL
jgi:hypothetical protein